MLQRKELSSNSSNYAEMLATQQPIDKGHDTTVYIDPTNPKQVIKHWHGSSKDSGRPTQDSLEFSTRMAKEYSKVTSEAQQRLAKVKEMDFYKEARLNGKPINISIKSNETIIQSNNVYSRSELVPGLNLSDYYSQNVGNNPPLKTEFMNLLMSYSSQLYANLGLPRGGQFDPLNVKVIETNTEVVLIITDLFGNIWEGLSEMDRLHR